jgi:ribosomal protein S18 acetylase RimI-like enzyme
MYAGGPDSVYTTGMVYPLRERDVDRAARLLSQAFVDYPVFRHIVTSDRSRSSQLQHLFRFLVRLGMSKGDVFAPSERIEGVSIWIDSHRMSSSFFEVLRAGILGAGWHLGLAATKRLVEVGTKKQEHRARAVAQRYCLLDMIAVDPSMQKRGLGRTMIDDKLARLDRAGVPCYLETSESANLAYYGKLGFAVAHEYRIADIDVYGLLRPVGTPASA